MRSCKDPTSLPRLHSIKSPPSIIPQTRALFDVAHDPTFGDPGPSNTHTAFYHFTVLPVPVCVCVLCVRVRAGKEGPRSFRNHG